MKVICIDDRNRPNDIPTSKWVKKGKEYTIIKVDKILMQGGILGCQLEEIDLSDCFPYNYFSLNRFAPAEPDNKASEIKEKELELEEELV